jgi:Ca2+-transporting ATPase
VVIAVYGLSRRDWLEAFLAGLTLAMAILPNEFPAVLAIFLALGAWRVSRKRALTRRLPVLETLGAATVLCVDKTGTLTANQMSVRRLFQSDRFYDVPSTHAPLPEFVHEVVEYAILASQRDPFDPMEKAFKSLGERRLAGTEHLHPQWTLKRQYPLSDELLALSHVWKSPDSDEHVIAAKGAYEAIADLCHLAEGEDRLLHEKVHAMARDGLRVLAVARCRFRPGTLPDHQHDFPFDFVGLVGLADPVRETVPAAIAECRNAGIRVVMITGDHPQTARSIALQIGLPASENVISGVELDAMSDTELTSRIQETSVFARVAPEQKLRIVQALQKAGEIVAMTGDGVNDAPALKAADIGIAMGGRGTDVAREASSLVLLDDHFATIVDAVMVGRRIFDNLKNAMAYILGIHVPIAGMTVLPVLFGWPLVLLPVHIAFLHLIIEPACAVVFEVEPEAPDIMRRRPRDPRAPLFGRALVGESLLRGAVILGVLLAVFWITLHHGRGEVEARGLTFATLVVANLSLIIVNRSQTRSVRETLRMPNRALWWVMNGAVAFLLLVLYVPFLRSLFRIAILHVDDVALAMVAGVASVAWLQLVKLLAARRRQKRSPRGAKCARELTESQ